MPSFKFLVSLRRVGLLRQVCFACCEQWADENNLTNVYLAYTAEGADQAMRPQTAKSGRPKTANKSRTARRLVSDVYYC